MLAAFGLENGDTMRGPRDAESRLHGPARSIQLAKMSYEKLGLTVAERFGILEESLKKPVGSFPMMSS